MYFAVFIVPKGDLFSQIAGWKRKIKFEFGTQPLLSHPPHMTLYHFETDNRNKTIDSFLELTTAGVCSFNIRAGQPIVFWDDQFAGGHTICFAVEQNKSLSKLQRTIADHYYLAGVAKKAKKCGSLGNELQNSYKKYGSPFIGDHWIPHFSVASIIAEKENVLFNDFMKCATSYKNIVDELSLWEIKGDEHNKIANIKL